MEQNTQEFLSQLRSFSLGIVTADKPYDQDMIMAFPVEHMFGHEGDVGDKSSIEAKWLPKALSNRHSAPDVCKGETVEIFRYADTDKYYWTTLMREPALRKKEHATYLWSNVPRGDEQVAGPDNSYWLRVSPKDGVVHFHTPDNDGELTTYDVSINTKEGKLVIKDGKDNTIFLNSATNKLVAVIQEDIILEAKSKVIIKAGESLTVQTPVVTVNASSSVTLNTPITNTKAMSVDGDISQNGGISSSGVHSAAGHV